MHHGCSMCGGYCRGLLVQPSQSFPGKKKSGAGDSRFLFYLFVYLPGFAPRVHGVSACRARPNKARLLFSVLMGGMFGMCTLLHSVAAEKNAGGGDGVGCWLIFLFFIVLSWCENKKKPQSAPTHISGNTHVMCKSNE